MATFLGGIFGTSKKYDVFLRKARTKRQVLLYKGLSLKDAYYVVTNTRVKKGQSIFMTES